jgi:transcriptional regulator with XRE-family HTH domain
MSFQILLSPSRRAAARFISDVRRKLLMALAQESSSSGLTQSDLAREINVHRSVINRELRGYKDITLGRVAELAHAMGREVVFELKDLNDDGNANEQLAKQPPTSIPVKEKSP